mgnify:CR=1 FL=1
MQKIKIKLLDVDPPYITTDPALFQHHLDTVSVQGGLDCPEMALSGIFTKRNQEMYC